MLICIISLFSSSFHLCTSAISCLKPNKSDRLGTAGAASLKRSKHPVMNFLPSLTKGHTLSNKSLTPTYLNRQKEKVFVSLAGAVARSPIAAPTVNQAQVLAARTKKPSKLPRKKRQVWSTIEDAELARLVKKHQRDQPNWVQIAEELNRNLQTLRTGKQCRERWRNHMRPNIKKGAWTISEERMIRKMYQTFGPQWSCMAKLLDNRTDNDIKNKLYSMIRSGKVEKVINPPNKTEKTATTPKVLEFPPAFGLEEIEVSPVSNGPPTAPSYETSSSTGEGIGFSYSWGTLSIGL